VAYPMILARQNVLVASHTGSGKTLAYLLPIAQELKRQEEREGYVGKPRRPRVIVLAPTRELTEQIQGVARQLSHHVKLRTVCLSTAIKCAHLRLPAPRTLRLSTAIKRARPSHLAQPPHACACIHQARTGRVARSVRRAAERAVHACRPSVQKRALAAPVDVVVATPQHVVAQMAAGALAISDV
jgi:ATP-dependent helicase YprA (DUF1998 family)